VLLLKSFRVSSLVSQLSCKVVVMHSFYATYLIGYLDVRLPMSMSFLNAIDCYQRMTRLENVRCYGLTHRVD
jgi:hypothetical protein